MTHSKRMDALFNEYKGNLFEFLIAKEIAKSFDFETTFLGSFHDNDFKILSQQEDFVRNHYADFLYWLPKAARESADVIIEKLQIKDLVSLKVIGKKEASNSQNKNYNEADLLIGTSQSVMALSIKFSKGHSFLNTKSAGIKSFFSKYFLEESLIELQDIFNRFWELEFEVFARKMHELVDLNYTTAFETWEKYRSERLPGELTGDLKETLYEFYNVINTSLYNHLLDLFEKDEKKFKVSLMSLLGYSDEKIYQLVFLYKNSKNFETSDILLHSFRDVQLKLNESNLEFQLNKSNIEIFNNSIRLQIRLKPMNTFINKGFKINCSVKFN